MIEFRTKNGIISISHEGILEVEKALDNPDMHTKYFPPSRNIIIINKMINSQIQQNSPGAEQVINFNQEELKEIIKSLKENINQLGLGLGNKSDLKAEICTIEAQMSSSKPKPTIIAESLSSVRNILEGAAGSIIASELLSKVVTFLSN